MPLARSSSPDASTASPAETSSAAPPRPPLPPPPPPATTVPRPPAALRRRDESLDSLLDLLLRDDNAPSVPPAEGAGDARKRKRGPRAPPRPPGQPKPAVLRAAGERARDLIRASQIDRLETEAAFHDQLLAQIAAELLDFHPPSVGIIDTFRAELANNYQNLIASLNANPQTNPDLI